MQRETEQKRALSQNAWCGPGSRESAPHVEQANGLMLLRLTAEDAAVGDGASEAPGEHVFGSDHHGELLYGCGLSDKGCTTALLCQ